VTCVESHSKANKQATKKRRNPRARLRGGHEDRTMVDENVRASSDVGIRIVRLVGSLRVDGELRAGVSRIAHQDNAVVRAGRGALGDRHGDVSICKFETLGEWVGGVQTSVVGQEDRPNGVRNVLGLVVDSPFNLFGLPNVPDGPMGWSNNLGNPHVPGDKIHRGSEDGRRNREENGESGRELHCDNGVWFREKVEGGGRRLKSLETVRFWSWEMKVT